MMAHGATDVSTLAITPAHLEPPKEYEPRRREALVEMTRYKVERRLQLADDVSLLFEDRRTITHQIQEMVRMEGDDEEALASVFRHYADLMPNGEDLIATLFVEVREEGQIKSRLRDYAQLAQSLWLERNGTRLDPVAVGDAGSSEAAAAVTYLRFPLPADWRTSDGRIELVVDHPRLEVRKDLSPAMRQVPA